MTEPSLPELEAEREWPVVGADASATLRCQQASSTWEATCNMPRI